jgi:hypothetical protein
MTMASRPGETGIVTLVTNQPLGGEASPDNQRSPEPAAPIAPRGWAISHCPLTIIVFVFDTYQMCSLPGEQKYERDRHGMTGAQP